MIQPSTAPTTTVAVIILFDSLIVLSTVTEAVMLFVSLMVVGGSKSPDSIEAHLILVVTIAPVDCVYLADTQQS